MRTIDSTVRTNYLSGDVTPKITGTIRRLRLDFGGAPLVYSGTLSSVVSDDFHGKHVWGDACTTDSSGYHIRLVNEAVWGGTADYYASKTNDGSDAADWAYSDITNSGTTPADYCRVGIYPKASSDSILVWYVDSNDNLYREELDPSTWSWSDKTTAAALGITPDAVAVHPVSESLAFVVGYTEPYLWVKRMGLSGDFWQAGSLQVLWIADSLEYTDAHFSDAIHLSGTDYVITVNLQTLGAAYAIIHDSDSGVYSQPHLICGGDADWTGYRVKPTGLSSHNSRLWLVCQREIEASDETPMGFHTALLSSSDGKNWREEDFVGVHPCYGKLLYDSGDTYCFVAGNAAVYKADATYKLGHDRAAFKQTITEGSQWAVKCAGPGSAHEITIDVLDDSDAWSGSSLLEAGNEVTVEISTEGESDSTLITGYLVQDGRRRTYDQDRFQLLARGPISKMAGPTAWHSLAGRLYEGPEAFYSNFDLQRTNYSAARFTVAQVSGTWGTEWDTEKGGHILEGHAGLAVVPRNISAQWLTYLVHLKMKVSIEGSMLVFYYEDDENYWRAGILRTDSGDKPVSSSTVYLAIQRVIDGEATTKASSVITPSLDTSYTLYLDLRPGTVRIYYDTDDNLDGATSVSYDLTGETYAVPVSYHVGLESLDWQGYGGGSKDGYLTVVDNEEPIISLNIYDGGAGMDSGDVGKFCRIGEDFNRIISVPAAGQMYLDSAWPDTPEVNDAYGIYAEEPDNGVPYTIYEDLMFCSGQLPWTLDDIADSILETVGVGRTSVTTVNVPELSDSSPYMRDVDVKWTTAEPSFIFAATRQDSSYTGYRVVVGEDYTELRHVSVEDGDVLLNKWPNLTSINSLESTEVRLLFDQSENAAYVYGDDHLLCSFWGLYTSGGYTAVGTGIGTGVGTGTSTEYRDMKQSFIWDVDEDANTGLANLFRDRRCKMVERATGAVSISAYDNHGELGTWSTPLVALETTRSADATMVELEGADVRAYYIEPDRARYRLLFRRASNEAVTGEVETVREAKRLTDLAEEKSTHVAPRLYAPDPAIELEDEVTIDGTDYIINSYALFLGGSVNEIQANMDVEARTKHAAETTENWGTATWGQFRWG